MDSKNLQEEERIRNSSNVRDWLHEKVCRNNRTSGCYGQHHSQRRTLRLACIAPNAAQPQPKTRRVIRRRAPFVAPRCHHKAKVKLGPTRSLDKGRASSRPSWKRVFFYPTSVMTGGSVFVFLRRASPVAQECAPTGSTHGPRWLFWLPVGNSSR